MAAACFCIGGPNCCMRRYHQAAAAPYWVPQPVTTLTIRTRDDALLEKVTRKRRNAYAKRLGLRPEDV